MAAESRLLGALVAALPPCCVSPRAVSSLVLVLSALVPAQSAACELPKLQFSLFVKAPVPEGAAYLSLQREDGTDLFPRRQIQKGEVFTNDYCVLPQVFALSWTQAAQSSGSVMGVFVSILYRGVPIVSEAPITGTKTIHFTLTNLIDLRSSFQTFQSQPLDTSWRTTWSESMPNQHYPFAARESMTKYYVTRFNYERNAQLSLSLLVLVVTFESGTVVYLNGHQLASINLVYPVAPHASTALSCLVPRPTTIYMPVDHLKVGENILSFEVHKCSTEGFEEDFFGVNSLMLGFGYKQCNMFFNMNADPNANECVPSCYNAIPYDERAYRSNDDNLVTATFMPNSPQIVNGYFQWIGADDMYYTIGGVMWAYGVMKTNRHIATYSISGVQSDNETMILSPVYRQPILSPFAYRYQFFETTPQSFHRWRMSNLTSTGSVNSDSGCHLVLLRPFGCTHACLATGIWPTTLAGQRATVMCPGSTTVNHTRLCAGDVYSQEWAAEDPSECPHVCTDEGDGFGVGVPGQVNEIPCVDGGKRTKECLEGGVWGNQDRSLCEENHPISLSYGRAKVEFPIGIRMELFPTVTGYSYQTYRFTATRLPSGMTLDADTGVLYGTPSGFPFEEMEYTITLQAGPVVRRANLLISYFQIECPSSGSYKRVAGGQYSAESGACPNLGLVQSYCRGDMYPPVRETHNNCYNIYPNSFTYPTLTLMLPLGQVVSVNPVIVPSRPLPVDVGTTFSGLLREGMQVEFTTGVIFGTPVGEEGWSTHNVTLTTSGGETRVVTLNITFFTPKCEDEGNGFGSAALGETKTQTCLEGQQGSHFRKCLDTYPPLWSPTYRTCGFPPATISYETTSYTFGLNRVVNVPGPHFDYSFQYITVSPNDLVNYGISFNRYTGQMSGSAMKLMEPTVYSITAYNELNEPSNTVELTLAILDVVCPDDGQFPQTAPAKYGMAPCPPGQSGMVSRFCSIEGVWDKTTNSSNGLVVNGIDYSKCRYYDPILTYPETRFTLHVDVQSTIAPTNMSFTTRLWINATDRSVPEGLTFDALTGVFKGTPSTEYRDHPTRIYYYNVANVSKDLTLFFTSTAVLCFQDTVNDWKQTSVYNYDAKFCPAPGQSGVMSRLCTLNTGTSLGEWQDPVDTCRAALPEPTVSDLYVASSLVVVVGSGLTFSALDYYAIQSSALALTSAKPSDVYFTVEQGGAGGATSNLWTVLMRMRTSEEKKAEDMARFSTLTETVLQESVVLIAPAFPGPIRITGPRLETGRPVEKVESKGLSTGAVVGIAVGSAVAVVAIVAAVCMLRESRKKRSQAGSRRAGGRGGRGGRGSARGGRGSARGGRGSARGGRGSARGGRGGVAPTPSRGRGSSRGVASRGGRR